MMPQTGDRPAPKHCQTCRYYDPAEVHTTAGRVTLRICDNRASPHFMTLPGPFGSCEKYHGGPLEGKI